MTGSSQVVGRPYLRRRCQAGEPGPDRRPHRDRHPASATPAEVALAWLLAQKPWIVPPGTRKLDRLEENISAGSVTLTAGDLRDINDLTTTIEVQGACYPEHLKRMTNL